MREPQLEWRKVFKFRRVAECRALGHRESHALTMAALVFLLAGIGLYAALYFLFVHYEIIETETGMLPSFCRLTDVQCASLVHSPDAHLFGMPNATLGVVYYVVVVAEGVFGWGEVPLWFARGTVIISWFVVAVGSYLVYSLFFKLRVPCRVCIAAHVVNLALAALLTFGVHLW